MTTDDDQQGPARQTDWTPPPWSARDNPGTSEAPPVADPAPAETGWTTYTPPDRQPAPVVPAGQPVRPPVRARARTRVTVLDILCLMLGGAAVVIAGVAAQDVDLPAFPFWALIPLCFVLARRGRAKGTPSPLISRLGIGLAFVAVLFVMS